MSQPNQNIWTSSVSTIDNLLLATALGANYNHNQNLTHNNLRLHQQKKHNNHQSSSGNLSKSNSSKSNSGSSLTLTNPVNSSSINNNNCDHQNNNTFPHHNFYSSQIANHNNCNTWNRTNSVCSAKVSDLFHFCLNLFNLPTQAWRYLPNNQNQIIVLYLHKKLLKQ